MTDKKLFCPSCVTCKNMTRNNDGGYCRMFKEMPLKACDYFIDVRSPSNQYLEYNSI